MIPSVVAVRALPDYRLALVFQSGERRVFEAKSYLDRGLFRELTDPSLFAQARLALGTVEWPNGADLDPEVLFAESVASETSLVFDAALPQKPSSSPEAAMPTISMFQGILIRMFAGTREHDPPHIHALYQEHQATFRIDDCQILVGTFPAGKRRLVEAWIELRRDELMADWQLAREGQPLERIEPLR